MLLGMIGGAFAPATCWIAGLSSSSFASGTAKAEASISGFQKKVPLMFSARGIPK